MDRRKILNIASLVVYLIVLGMLCFGNFSSTSENIPKCILGLDTDKIVHFLMFFPFPILCWRLFYSGGRKPLRSLVIVLAIFVAGCLLAAGTELCQCLTDYRAADALDFRADGLGLAVASLICFILELRHKK